MKKLFQVLFVSVLSLGYIIYNTGCNQPDAKAAAATKDSVPTPVTGAAKSIPTTLDSADYDRKMLAMSNHDTTGKWPAKAAYPLPGAVLPYNRIVSFYGNLYSKKMGILGQIPHDSMISQLLQEVAKNEKQPFHILLSDSSGITVLGTHFNVMSYNNEKSKEITLLEGSVSVSSKNKTGR